MSALLCLFRFKKFSFTCYRPATCAIFAFNLTLYIEETQSCHVGVFFKTDRQRGHMLNHEDFTQPHDRFFAWKDSLCFLGKLVSCSGHFSCYLLRVKVIHKYEPGNVTVQLYVHWKTLRFRAIVQKKRFSERMKVVHLWDEFMLQLSWLLWSKFSFDQQRKLRDWCWIAMLPLEGVVRIAISRPRCIFQA